MGNEWYLEMTIIPFIHACAGRGGGFCDGSARAREDHKDYSFNRLYDQAIDQHGDQS